MPPTPAAPPRAEVPRRVSAGEIRAALEGCGARVLEMQDSRGGIEPGWRAGWHVFFARPGGPMRRLLVTCTADPGGDAARLTAFRLGAWAGATAFLDDLVGRLRASPQA